MKDKNFSQLNNSNYFISPKILYGINVLYNIESELNRLGYKNILLITNEVLKNTSAVESFIKYLFKNLGYSVKIFTTEAKEPTLDMVKAVVEFTRSEKDGIVIGLGGGSVMDQSKIAAVLAKNTGEIEDFVGDEKVKNNGLPLMLVPATAGTGSEVSMSGLFVNSDGKKLQIKSRKMLASLAIVDPVVTLSLPPKPTAYTGMDALSHAIESIMSINCTSLIMPIALEAVSLIKNNLPTVYLDGSNIHARLNMSIGSTLAGLSLNSGVVLGHSIGYTLDRFGLPHGMGVAVALAYITKFNLNIIPDKIRCISKAMGYEGDFDDFLKVSSFLVDSIKSLIKLLDIPLSLQPFGINLDTAYKLADECYSKYPRPNNPRKYTRDEIREIYKQMYKGVIAVD